MAKNNQLLRSVLGTILTSKLSDLELRSLVRDLRNGDFASDLADLLDRLVADYKRDYKSDESVNSSNYYKRSFLRKAELIVQKRRLSKNALLNIVSAELPGTILALLTPSMSVSAILASLAESLPENRAQELLAAMESSKSDDPFLKGIKNRP